jgi:Rrf2 family protein
LAHISTGVEYGLHCLIYLAQPSGGGATAASARDLAELQGLPVEFVAKLFTRLEKAGLVDATEGVRGGFRLARAPDAISVLDVVEAVDGAKPLFECREIRGRCAVFGDVPPPWSQKGVCSIHAVMLEAEHRMREVMARQTLGAIAARVAAKAPADFEAAIVDWLGARAAARRPGRDSMNNSKGEPR